ncbi:MAG TPA: peptidylprolyl isomerase [Chthoniobacterales bacterium]|jgi:cyclophilin family peptidyl-prolyl cis-trans isomerase
MHRFRFSIFVLLAGLSFSAVAQNTPPIVTNQIGDFSEYAGASPRVIDLTSYFTDPDVSAAVRMTTVLGDIDIGLFGKQTPITVANFLQYIDQGKYFIVDPTTNQVAPSIIHRSLPGFVIQGGGFLGTVDPNNPNNVQLTQVATLPKIQNEPGISNKRGTVAMAKLPNDPNSATSQWFINLADNGGGPNNLDTQDGGFTVFGRVVGNGMTTADAIAAVPRYNFGSPLDSMPLRDYDPSGPVKVPNLISVPAFAHISPLNFSAASDNPNVCGVAVSGTELLVGGGQVGTAHITVTATDLDGASVSQNFTVTVLSAPGRLVQLSTRMQVGTGDNALIGGFIIRGDSPKRLMIRGIGPSTGLAGALADPVLELHDNTGAVIASNDNWGDAANKQEMINTGIAPTSPNESAILMTVPSDPNNASYTAIVRGANNSTGIGLIEVYDLDSGPGSTLLNISTRGRVDLDPNILIGGFFLGGSDSKRVLVRAIGPSLAAAHIASPLSDPTLELHDGQGALIESNDDWGSSPEQSDIQASGLAPTNAKESAVLRTLAAGAYTAVMRGMNNATGIGSIEIYQLP